MMADGGHVDGDVPTRRLLENRVRIFMKDAPCLRRTPLILRSYRDWSAPPAARVSSTYAANYWQGRFPLNNTGADGWIGSTPAGCFARSSIGTYDLIGNVWEWTRSWYLPGHGAFVTGDGTPGNPSFDPRQPQVRARVIKGGSFLSAANYCGRYRPAARHAQEETLAASHLGFRTVGPAPS